jgi:hypothetical protein
MGSLTFTTTLAKRGPGVAVVLDADQVAAIGEGAKRFPVAATINGETWRSTVVRMRGEFLLSRSASSLAWLGRARVVQLSSESRAALLHVDSCVLA